MGREATISFEQIAAIADAMKIEGAKPTSRAVRERLGNTGSMGTINKLLGRWKSGQERQVSAALVLPPALQRAILDFMDMELTSARVTLEAELTEQQQEAADLATENERQIVENESQAQTIEQLRSEVSTHHGRAGQLESDLVLAREEGARERSGAELARLELAKAQLRLEAMPRLETELGSVRVVLESERLARVAAEQNAAVSAAKHEAAERRANESEARAVKNEEKADSLDRELKSLTTLVQSFQSKLENGAKELLDSKNAVATAQDTAKKLTEEIAELHGKLELQKK